MGTFLLIIHIIVCLMLIFVVLIQSSKGAQLGAAFGGSSQTLFGSRGASTFLSKFTTGMAVVFMLTSLFLTIVSVQKKTIVKPTPVTRDATIPLDKAGVKTTVDTAPVKSDQAPAPEPEKTE